MPYQFWGSETHPQAGIFLLFVYFVEQQAKGQHMDGS